MSTTINVAAYCRVSTDHEDQLNSLAAQIKYFSDYISQHEGYCLKQIYHDEGITGTSVRKRDSFNRMIADAEKGEISLILTKEVSRFARNTVDTLTYTRRLSALGVAVVFMNDGINTMEKDGELRLTIMASIAQEESRKTSERVKWGLRRKMENGFVLGGAEMLGFRKENGVLTIVPEEAEIVRRIFRSYVYEGKGGHRIAHELNEAKMFTVNGYCWHNSSIRKILVNDRYVGDLTQAKYYIADYLTKTLKKNNGEIPLVHIADHHEAIIDRETFDKAQEILKGRREVMENGRKPSSSYWFSGKFRCGMCGYSFTVNGSIYEGKSAVNRTIRCRNRSMYGAETRVNAKGEKVGCASKGTNQAVVEKCMVHIIEHLQGTRDEIIADLLTEMNSMQTDIKAVDVKALRDEIEKISRKKRNAIDLMLENLITKDDLKTQTAFYESEIARLNEEIRQSQDVGSVHENQIRKVKEYIAKVKKTSEIAEYNDEVFGELLDYAVVQDGCTIDFYLKCVPFGFRVKYHTHLQTGKGYERNFCVYVDSCTITP